LSLVYLGDGIPARSIFLDASLFHEEVDEVFLLCSYLSEVMQVVPDIQIEVILDAG
jgi:hypothetical protein